MVPKLNMRKSWASFDYQKHYHQILMVSEVELRKKALTFSGAKEVKRGIVYQKDTAEIVSLNTDRYFFRIDVELDSDLGIQVKKDYANFAGLLSYLGGLFKGVSFVFLIIVWPFREVQFYRKLINQMFIVCETVDDLELVFSRNKNQSVSMENKRMEKLVNMALSKFQKGKTPLVAKKKEFRKGMTEGLKARIVGQLDESKNFETKRSSKFMGSIIMNKKQKEHFLDNGFRHGKETIGPKVNFGGILTRLEHLSDSSHSEGSFDEDMLSIDNPNHMKQKENSSGSIPDFDKESQEHGSEGKVLEEELSEESDISTPSNKQKSDKGLASEKDREEKFSNQQKLSLPKIEEVDSDDMSSEKSNKIVVGAKEPELIQRNMKKSPVKQKLEAIGIHDPEREDDEGGDESSFLQKSGNIEKFYSSFQNNNSKFKSLNLEQKKIKRYWKVKENFKPKRKYFKTKEP